MRKFVASGFRLLHVSSWRIVMSKLCWRTAMAQTLRQCNFSREVGLAHKSIWIDSARCSIQWSTLWILREESSSGYDRFISWSQCKMHCTLGWTTLFRKDQRLNGRTLERTFPKASGCKGMEMNRYTQPRKKRQHQLSCYLHNKEQCIYQSSL